MGETNVDEEIDNNDSFSQTVKERGDLNEEEEKVRNFLGEASKLNKHN